MLNEFFYNTTGDTPGPEPEEYVINRSLRFNSEDSAYLNWTPTSAGNRRTWTWSGWVKKSEISTTRYPALFFAGINTNGNAVGYIYFNADNTLTFTGGVNGVSTDYNLVTTQVFRDPSSWYHLVFAFDTTQVVESERLRIYVNGNRVNDFSSSTYPPVNYEGATNSTVQHTIGSIETAAYFNGYLAELNFIDGQALTADDFGAYDSDGVWQPKEYTIDKGTNYSNDLTLEGTLFGGSSLSNAFNGDTTSSAVMINLSNNQFFTFTPSTAIPYSSSVEVFLTPTGDVGATQYTVNGSGNQSFAAGDGWKTILTGSGELTSFVLRQGAQANSVGFSAIRIDGTTILVDALPSNSFYLDFNNTSSNGALGYDQSDITALDASSAFKVVEYTGNGATQVIDSVGFQPDLVWIKAENSSSYSHNIFDSFRGAKEVIYSDSAVSENTDATSLTSFVGQGFSIGSTAAVNNNGTEYVAWSWKAGGESSTNNAGNIPSEVSVDTEYGFSVTNYVGNGNNQGVVVGHGLGATPEFIIIKNRDQNANWYVYHSGLDAGKGLNLNSTEAQFTPSEAGVTAVDSTTFTLGSKRQETNGGGNNHVAYCWSGVTGFSKFGTYTGSSGTIKVTTGFKPSYVLIKCISDAGQEWIIKDSVRGGDKTLIANSSGTQTTDRNVVFNADGFSPAGGQGPTNFDGRTYIYAAFADRAGNNWTVNNLVAKAVGDPKANRNMDVLTYTGTGNQITVGGLQFQPDFCWIKDRSASNANTLWDSVRGVQYRLVSNDTTGSQYRESGLLSFNSDGITQGSSTSGDNYVVWCWKAGNANEANTDGSIVSTVSANPEYGFSIVSYVGTNNSETIGHGLSRTPDWIIVKDTSSSSDWQVYHSAYGAKYYGILNAADQFRGGTSGAYTDKWNLTEPTNDVFTVGKGDDTNRSGSTMIAYCWSGVDGFSKFGSYTGTGNSNGEIVNCGFKPRYVMIKEGSGTGNWSIYDTLRGGVGTNNKTLQADTNVAESNDSNTIDILDTGFQASSSASNVNASGQTYVYAAFAGIPEGKDVDSMIDTPTNYESESGNNGGNYATYNSISVVGEAGKLRNGNLSYSGTYSGAASYVSTIAAEKFYYEVVFDCTDGNGVLIGVIGVDQIQTEKPGQTGEGYAWRAKVSSYFENGIKIGTYGQAYVADGTSIIGVAFDSSLGTLEFFVDGVSQGFASTSIPPGKYYAITADGGTTSTMTDCTTNFGQRPFAYAPPAGYKSLCAANLNQPTIASGEKHITTVTRPGGGTTQVLDFGPDLVWAKNRSADGNHYLYDRVRGDNKYLSSNTSNIENTGDGALTFTADGYSVSSSFDWSASNSIVEWCWNAGDETETIAPGDANAAVYQMREIWSDHLTAASNAVKKPTSAFDGVIDSNRTEGSGGLTLTIPGGLQVHSSVEVIDSSGITKSQATINGVAQPFVQHTGNTWVTIFSGSGTLDSIYSERTDNDAFDAGFTGVRVDGRELINTDINPPVGYPSISSEVRANPAAGFSIIKYTCNSTAGATVAHGLNAAPEFVIARMSSQTASWAVYHKALGASAWLMLNSTNGAQTNTQEWSGVEPTTGTVTIGNSSANTNAASGATAIMYAFASVEGYSKFGSYEGNGSASDGPFIYTGFRPAFILIKGDASIDWIIEDASRDPFNEMDKRLYPNDSVAESVGSNGSLDFLSNGFKPRTNHSSMNNSGTTYLYACFASHPFKTSRAR